MLTVDSDEAFIIYPEELEKFAASGKFAGTVTEKLPVTAEYSLDFPGSKRKIFNKASRRPKGSPMVHQGKTQALAKGDICRIEIQKGC